MDYNSIFEIIEDECLDILQNSNYGKRQSATFTADTTIKLVMKELRAPVNKRSRKKISKKILIIAIAATLLFSTAVCGNSYWKIWREGGAERITNDNRDIVGKEVIHSGYYPEHPNDRKDIPPTSLTPNEIVKTAEKVHISHLAWISSQPRRTKTLLSHLKSSQQMMLWQFSPHRTKKAGNWKKVIF